MWSLCENLGLSLTFSFGAWVVQSGAATAVVAATVVVAAAAVVVVAAVVVAPAVVVAVDINSQLLTGRFETEKEGMSRFQFFLWIARK